MTDKVVGWAIVIVLQQKLEGNGRLGRSRHRWWVSIKSDPKNKMGSFGLD